MRFNGTGDGVAQPGPDRQPYSQDHGEHGLGIYPNSRLRRRRTGWRAPSGRAEVATARVLMLRGALQLHGT